MIGLIFAILVVIPSTGWVGYALFHALTTGEMYGRPVNTFRSERPISFWLQFTIGSFGFVLMILIGVAMIIGLLLHI